MANAVATATAKWIAEIQAERAKSLKSPAQAQSAPPPSAAPAAPAAQEKPAEAKPAEAKREEDKEAAPPDVDLDRLEEDLESDADLSTRLLGLLYYRRKENPDVGALSILKCEQALGVDRGGLAFVLYLLKSRRLAESDDKSRLRITIDGIEALRRMMRERSPNAQ